MARLPRPTDSELAILRVLWDRGPSTVRAVHEALVDARETGYTTTLKLMQIMADKRLVARDESQRSHVYRPLVEESPTQRRLVLELIDRAFEGSASRLVLNALSSRPTSKDELAQIRALLDEIEKRPGRRGP